MSADSQMLIPFDLDAGLLPDALDHAPSDSGEVLVLLADPSVRESGWAPRAAVGLAQGWAASGHRVLLMDGSVDEPALHTVMGEENTEGVTDAVLYGVSPSRIARTVGKGLLLATAGTVAADSAAVFRHPRWTSVLAACRDSGSLVLLYLPAGESGVEALTALADRVIRFRGESAGSEEVTPGTVILHPTDQESPSPMSVEPEGRTSGDFREVDPAPPSRRSDDESRVPAGAVAPGDQQTLEGGAGGQPRSAPGSVDGATSAPRSTGKTPSEPRPRRDPGRRFLLLILLLVVIVAVLVGAAFLGFVDIPGITPEAAAAALSAAPAGSP